MQSDSSDIQFTARKRKELAALVDRIIECGALGKSRTYRQILRYLVECRLEGIAPKESSIAIDVLAKDVGFDISRDSSVRVYMYQLRSKLEEYFQNAGKDERYVLTIPKGQYGLSLTLRDGAVESIDEDAREATGVEKDGGPQTQLAGRRYATLIATLAGGCALLVLLAGIFHTRFAGMKDAASEQWGNAIQSRDDIADYGFWRNILDDSLPVLVLVGDYHSHGEHYIPMGTASAMAVLMPFLDEHAREVRVKMMSQFNTADLVNQHVIYLGLLSGLSQLQNLMFSASGLRAGAGSNELRAVATNEQFLSNYDDLGESVPSDPDIDNDVATESNDSFRGDSFRDYGIISTFTAPRGNQLVLLVGLRDAGLVAVAEQAIDEGSLDEISRTLDVPREGLNAFEAVYEAVGLRSTSFDTRLVHSQALDSAVIWATKLTNPHASP